MKTPSWFTIKASADGAEVSIYGPIGAGGVTAQDFANNLKAYAGQPLTVRIHSAGGSVFDGVAIHTAISQHDGGASTCIDGLAASMATIVALAGSPVSMCENGFFMIHDPSAATYGSGDDIRKDADLLDKLSDMMAGIYSAKSGKPVPEIKKAMAAETWYTAKEAKAAGFIDEITAPIQAAASLDLSKFAKPPPAAVALTHPVAPCSRARFAAAIGAGITRTNAATATPKTPAAATKGAPTLTRAAYAALTARGKASFGMQGGTVTE